LTLDTIPDVLRLLDIVDYVEENEQPETIMDSRPRGFLFLLLFVVAQEIAFRRPTRRR